jgi:hypothetical protein
MWEIVQRLLDEWRRMQFKSVCNINIVNIFYTQYKLFMALYGDVEFVSKNKRFVYGLHS